jgi:hypothetical protein
MSYFSDVELIFPEGNNDLNTWADYCEFFCLASENKSRTIEDLKNQLLEQYQKDFRKARNAIALSRSRTGKFIADSMILEDAAAEDDIISGNSEIDFDDVTEDQKSDESQLEDEINGEFLFLFRFLESRTTLFNESYPYKIEIKANKLSLIESSQLIGKQKIYIALLLSSILRIYKPGIRNKLGHLFEDLTQFPFKKLIPTCSTIEFFGAGQKNTDESFFSGSFAKRVEKLASVLYTDTTTIFKENKHDYLHSGDGGLDWVAWAPFEDNISKIPVFLGQCACGDDWIDKEWDAHDDKWSNLIQLHNSYLLFHFIGKSYRKHNGDWFKPGDIYNIILIDRFRLITSLNLNEIDIAVNIYDGLVKEGLALNYSDSD